MFCLWDRVVIFFCLKMALAEYAPPPTNSMSSAASHEASGPQVPSGNAPAHTRLDPHLIGWTFVQNYYTVLSKEPGKLHCFFSKNSIMLRGIEGEEVPSCHGQQVGSLADKKM